MEIINNILGSAVTIAISAFLGYKLGLKSEGFKKYQDLKSQAYVDFTNAVTGIANSQKDHDSKKETEFRQQLTDAKMRIAIFGSKDVIESTAYFFRKYGKLDSKEGCNSFLDIIRKIARNRLIAQQIIKT